MEKLSSEHLSGLHEQLSLLARQYQLRDGAQALAHGLSVSETYALTTLHRRGALPMSALAREMHLSLGAMTKVIDSLERQKLVTRKASKADGRVQEARLTPKGETLYQKIHQDFLGHLAETLGEIPARDRAAVIQGLRVINQSVLKWRDRIKGAQEC